MLVKLRNEILNELNILELHLLHKHRNSRLQLYEVGNNGGVIGSGYGATWVEQSV